MFHIAMVIMGNNMHENNSYFETIEGITFSMTAIIIISAMF